MGTPDIAVSALNSLVDAGHELLCVYTQPPRPAGRGHDLLKSAVHKTAEARGIMVRHPENFKNIYAKDQFNALGADLAVVMAYGLILPTEVLTGPKYGCINIHVSLLPRWRGAAPIQRAIMADDSQTGVSIMQMDEGLDTGPILLQECCPIGPKTTAQQLHDELAILGSKLVVQATSLISKGQAPGIEQAHTAATYAQKLSRAEGLIDWSLPASQIERNIRALNPWPGTWFEFCGERVRVLQASVSDATGDPGVILDNIPTIACGCEALELEIIQRSGRKALPAHDFLRGFALPVGASVRSI